MSTTATQQIVNKAWNFAHVLRDDGLSYMAYTEQITFLLFLKMADEQTKAAYNRPSIVPPKLGWASLLAQDGDALEVHYRHTLEELGRPPWSSSALSRPSQRTRSISPEPTPTRTACVPGTATDAFPRFRCLRYGGAWQPPIARV